MIQFYKINDDEYLYVHEVKIKHTAIYIVIELYNICSAKKLRRKRKEVIQWHFICSYSDLISVAFSTASRFLRHRDFDF